MSVGSTEGKTVVNQGGIDHESQLSMIQKVTKVAEMTMATPHTIPCAILIQYEDLTGTEPTLEQNIRDDMYCTKQSSSILIHILTKDN